MMFVMLWSPNVYILLLGRLLDGFGIVWIAVTFVPDYTFETSRPEIRGSLNTYRSSWGLVGSSFLTVWFSEYPRWLVSKGSMLEAKQVLQRLRGREDVACEMALQVEGLGVG
ncbi:hypothetical protein L1887_27624 [Cichorium endivia]|nr:hypothetical protein L1887_27624 [Cichorium endivia]